MAENAIIKIDSYWEKKDGDCRVCDGCNEPIYGNMYVYNVVGKEIDLSVCESCYGAISEQ